MIWHPVIHAIVFARVEAARARGARSLAQALDAHDEVDGWAEGLIALGQCLRDAGLACAAYDLGVRGEYDEEHGSRGWYPGCGYPAPT